MTFMYRNLVPSEVEGLKKFNKEMNILDDNEINNAQKANVVNYTADLIASLRSGLQWGQLTLGEQDLIKQNCHESHWKEFAEEDAPMVQRV